MCVCVCVWAEHWGWAHHALLPTLKPSLPLSGSRSCPHGDTHTPRNRIIVGKVWGPVSQTGRREHSIIITQCHNRMRNSFHIPSYTIRILKLDFSTEKEVESALGCVLAIEVSLFILGAPVRAWLMSAQNLLLQACPAGSEPGSRRHSWERGPAWKAELIFLAPASEGLGVQSQSKSEPRPPRKTWACSVWKATVHTLVCE